MSSPSSQRISVRHNVRSLATVSCAVISLISLVSLVGCGIGKLATTSPVDPNTYAIQGKVIGGQQPVSGAVIQLYAVGATGNGSPATPLLTRAVTTDRSGGFDITGLYPCTDPTQLVYITATGGNPGLPGTVSNPALALVNALGTCGALRNASFIAINEVTTAAAAWALAPFMRSTTMIGSTASNVAGIRNAFATANILADQASGFSPSSSISSNATVENAKVYALADVIAACVNSDGTTPCASLFTDVTPSGSAAPTDTLLAALSVVTHPGHNVTGIYNHISPTSPFSGALSSAPNDWTMSITYTGGGLSSPTQLGLDSVGNVWVASYNNVLSGFTQQGVPILPNGTAGSGLQSSYGMTIDAGNNIWVTNEEGDAANHGWGSISRFTNTGAPTSGSSGFAGGGVYFPHSDASDPNGNIWVANYGNSSVTLLSTTGAAVSSSAYGGSSLAFPEGIAVDANSNAWVANNGSDNLTSIASDGTIRYSVPTGASTDGIAIDGNGGVWATSYYGSSLVNVSSAGLLLSPLSPAAGYAGGGINYPKGLAIDGSNNIFVANFRGSSFSEVSGATLTSGTPISPATGYGLDATLIEPFGIAVDSSGSIWVSSFGTSTVVTFVGLATPVRTPLVGPPQLP